MAATHEVSNQPPEWQLANFFTHDLPLQNAMKREQGALWDALEAYGACAAQELYPMSFDAQRDRPRLQSFDRFGQRTDRVLFHPHYHAIMRLAVSHGVSNFSWRQEGQVGAHVVRAALSYLHYQAEPGTSCPLTMTHAAAPLLKRYQPDWYQRICAPHYDQRELPAMQKSGITIGMGMTEKQGGSDVRSNSTRARASSDGFLLTGHKWFYSAPMSDAHLVLAQSDAGLSCFLLPRLLPDGRPNNIFIQRLKDKLGDHANASSEVEFENAHAVLIGPEGRGIATIIEMVMLTRLDCMLGSSALMRMALVQAVHHARYRHAFGQRLLEAPLMRRVLAELALESEAATTLSLRVAAAVERASTVPLEAAFARIATAIGKFWICKRAVTFVNEAQECLGGAGYVEESLLPRLYRQAPLNSIWEGSGNIQCLDVLRALEREPLALEALQLEIAACREAELGKQFEALLPQLKINTASGDARALVVKLATLLCAAALFRVGSPSASAYLRTRVMCSPPAIFGASSGLDEPALLRASGLD
jgi:putative acyl-CoA dehydrogenase